MKFSHDEKWNQWAKGKFNAYEIKATAIAAEVQNHIAENKPLHTLEILGGTVKNPWLRPKRELDLSKWLNRELVNSIAASTGVTRTMAANMFMLWRLEILKAINAGDRVTIEGLGVLQKEFASTQQIGGYRPRGSEAARLGVRVRFVPDRLLLNAVQ
jgi:nucleoid DNA-binding protein